MSLCKNVIAPEIFVTAVKIDILNLTLTIT